jgi:hypothetical protein
MSPEPVVDAERSGAVGAVGSDLEVSLAPREGDLLSLPFDQYGRMRVAQNLANTLYTHIAGMHGGPDAGIRLRVLDVGGYPGVLREFLSPDYYDVTVLDVVPSPGDDSMPWYVQASGLDLPYEDASFDVVTSLDTLEHIPGAGRARFLSEIMRVARHAALLINPVQSLEADLAEETLDEYVRWILDAQQEQLAEHREYGLPDFAATMAEFEAAGWQTAHFPIANVHNWLLMMVAKHYLISLRDERASGFERSLDRFYNLSFSDGDRATPAYRGVLVAVRPELEASLDRVRADYPPVESSAADNAMRLQLAQVLMTMLDLKTANHEDRLLREQMEHRDKHIAQMETRISIQESELERVRAEVTSMHGAAQARDRQMAKLEEDIRSKDEHILYLEKLLQAIESGRVMRMTRSVSRFLGRG